MEEQSPSSATSGDNFEAFMVDPLQGPLRPGPITSPLRDVSSPAFKPAPLNNEVNDGKAKSSLSSPVSPSRVSRSASLMSNLVQPWGLFGQGEEDNGPAETVRRPLMGHHPLSDEDEEEVPSNLGLGELSRNSLDGVSPSKLPTASAASTTQTFSNSPEAVTSARPVLNASPLSFAGRSFGGSSDLSSLRKLARQGTWKAVVDKVKAAKLRGALTTPVEELNYATYHILALMKLRRYGDAVDEFAAVGDLDAMHYRYEEYPSVYPDKSGSMVPFALRWMHAELPHRTGQMATTIERLYALLDYCNSKVESLQAIEVGSQKSVFPLVDTTADYPSNEDNDMAGGGADAPAEREEPGEETRVEEVGTTGEEEDFGEFIASDTTITGKLLLMWTNRKESIVYALVGHHLFQKQYIVALQWLNQLLARYPTDADLLSKVGYVQLQLGDLGGAQQTFSKVDALVTDTTDEKLLNLAGRNRGLLHFAEKQYTKAFNEFTAVLSRSPHDMVSANNKALCLMYQRELLGATSVLEDSLQSSPRSTLNETMVLNLCSMYELASMNSVESKRTLSAWLLNHAPDDFDLSCTRL